jgi:AAA domain, putative AbiEii toxin, Type IV TA system
MENVINTLVIQNFKSIRHAVLHPRRVNLIIGEPNVGKSTVLEAMSLLGALPFERKKKFMRSFIRYDEPTQVFHDGNFTNPVRIESDHDVCLLTRQAKGTGWGKGFQYGVFSQSAYRLLRVQLGLPLLESRPKNRATDDATLLGRLRQRLDMLGTLPEPGCRYLEFGPTGRLRELPGGAPGLASAPNWQPRAVKPFRFKSTSRLDRRYAEPTLYPPHGNNLVQVLEANTALRHNFKALFNEQHQELRVRADARRLEVMKDVDGLSVAYPYSGAGDTLRRFGFHMAAMDSSREAVILLEEPESHSYPGYIMQLAERMVAHESNQFFVTTHSPYFFDSVLENMVPYESLMPELAVFVVYYKDFQTKIRQMSDEEVRGLQRDSLDVFNNLHHLAHESLGRKV